MVPPPSILTVTRRSDGQVLFHNDWITDHFPKADNIVELVSVARSRWKTENENHNTLKTQGYHLAHIPQVVEEEH